jgi:NADH-quinone oxidoreductase subunit N
MAYFDEPEDGMVLSTGTFATRGVMSINGLLIIGLGILPGGLIALCERVITQSLVF